MRTRQKRDLHSKQRGVILFVALILLVILSLLGVTAARMQTTEERMARNEDNRQMGAQAAEAALRNAEAGIAGGNFNGFANNTQGQYTLFAPNGDWLTGTSAISWTNPAQVISYTAAILTGPPLSALPPAAQAPNYIIEQLPAVALPGDNIACSGYGCPTPTVTVYRVTANGTGADQSTSTLLQSIYR
jgi:type IV pilus assembly protein PilX